MTSQHTLSFFFNKPQEDSENISPNVQDNTSKEKKRKRIKKIDKKEKESKEDNEEFNLLEEISESEEEDEISASEEKVEGDVLNSEEEELSESQEEVPKKKKRKLVESTKTTESTKKKRKLSNSGRHNKKEENLEEEQESPKKKTKQSTLNPEKKEEKSAFDSLPKKKMKFHPIEEAIWKEGEPVPYLALAQTLCKIENCPGRLEITRHLTELFRSIICLTPEDLLPCLYLSINQMGPAFLGLELGLGEQLILKAIADSTGRTLKHLKESYLELGDLGLVAEQSRSTQTTMFTPAKLTIRGVFKSLKDIALESGHSSMDKKKAKIQGLLVACRDSEARFIAKSLQGKLRIGLAEKSALVALSNAVVFTPPSTTLPPPILDASLSMSPAKFTYELASVEKIIKTVYSELPDYDTIIPCILKHDVKKLHDYCHLETGIPVHPMLAHPTKGLSEVFDRLKENQFTCEYKYDGERCQVHYQDGKITTYSRNLETNTGKWPDVVSYLPNAIGEGVTSFILDSEVVAWDVEKKMILPFQILSTRSRKDVKIENVKVQVCLYVFDLLYLNGESLLRLPLRERREKLQNSFNAVEGQFAFVEYKDTNDEDEIGELLASSIKGSCEGLMVKTLDVCATYEPSRRSYNWLKIKKDYLQGMADTFDVVPIAGWMGKGKRKGVYGAYLCACYNSEDDDIYQTLCKVGTGFTDENLKVLTEEMDKHKISKPKLYYRVSSKFLETNQPDAWFEPHAVWEIQCADLSISPVHTGACGLVDEVKGIGLRFPRFIQVREDKKPEDATSAEQVAEMYNAQASISSATTHNYAPRK